MGSSRALGAAPMGCAHEARWGRYGLLASSAKAPASAQYGMRACTPSTDWTLGALEWAGGPGATVVSGRGQVIAPAAPAAIPCLSASWKLPSLAASAFAAKHRLTSGALGSENAGAIGRGPGCPSSTKPCEVRPPLLDEDGPR